VNSKSAGSDFAFPKGCTPLTIQVPIEIYHERGVRLTFRRASVDDMQQCNPRSVLLASKSNVIDIARRKNDEKGSLVTIQMPDFTAVIGVKDDNEGGNIDVLLCRPPELYTASWGTFVPNTPLRLTNRTSRLSAGDRSALIAECGGR
jgi:hypothetical protein